MIILLESEQSNSQYSDPLPRTRSMPVGTRRLTAPAAAAPTPASASETAEVMSSPTTAESTPMTPPATTTVPAARLLEPLTLCRTIHAILPLRIEVLRVPFAGRTLLIKALLALLHVGLAVGMPLLEGLTVLSRVGLRVRVLLFVILCVLVGLLLSLLSVYVAPGVRAVVEFLPA